VVIGSRAGAARIFADSVGMGASYYYWIQHVSNADVPGPVVGSGVGQAGVYGYTATDNTPMLNLLENALTGTHIQANAISSSELQALAVSTAHIQANAITSAQLQALAVSTAHIQANAITSAHILANAIAAVHIQANAITSAQIQANAITSIHILAGSILAAHIQANTITAAQIQAGSITGDRIVAGAIIASHLSVADLSAISANMGNLTAGTITLDQFGFIRSGNIAYASGVGFWMGYAGGAYKFYLGNPAGGYLDWNGSLLRIGGSAEFSGALSGATGTFSGSLSAATGTFSGSLSAATGTFGGSVTGTGVIGTAQIQDAALTAPKIAAGSVIAGKIAANAISAAGGEIADLTVSTLKIQDQAVTVPVSVTASDLQFWTNPYAAGTVTKDIIVGTVASSGSPVMILLSFLGDQSVGGPATVYVHRATFKLELLRDGSVIQTIYNAYFLGGTTIELFAMNLTDTPGAGVHTYTLRATWIIQTDGTGTGTVTYRYQGRSMLLLETKK
jgi:hypothetical protein